MKDEANKPNMRRLIRATRLCEELGHAGDMLAALEELKALREQVRLLELAEEGAKEAFGVVVQNCDDLKAEVTRLNGLLDSTRKILREYSSGIRTASLEV